MRVEASPRTLLRGWTPIIGALTLWFAHFLIVYGAALIWPHQQIANLVAVVATVLALLALATLLVKLRSADHGSDQTRFAKRVGTWSIFFAAAGVLFDALPALFG